MGFSVTFHDGCPIFSPVSRWLPRLWMGWGRVLQALFPLSLQVAYHGVPDKAYEVFVNALRSRYLQQRLIIPDLEDRNPAG